MLSISDKASKFEIDCYSNTACAHIHTLSFYFHFKDKETEVQFYRRSKVT